MEPVGFGIGTAFILGMLAYICIVTNLAPNLSLQEPIVVGGITGLIVGDPVLGLAIGGSLMLMSLGMHTFGGATIPDFQTGAILGTALGAIAVVNPDPNIIHPEGVCFQMATGMAVAIPAALLMTQLDVFGRAVTTGFIHGADKYVEEGNFRGLTLMHLLGHIPWGLTRFVPVFLAVWLGGGAIHAFVEWVPVWFMDGMRVTGTVLPALGFAMLLRQLPVKKYIPFLIIGYVMFVYLGVPVIGIAIAGVALALLYLKLIEGEASA